VGGGGHEKYFVEARFQVPVPSLTCGAMEEAVVFHGGIGKGSKEESRSHSGSQSSSDSSNGGNGNNNKDRIVSSSASTAPQSQNATSPGVRKKRSRSAITASTVPLEQREAQSLSLYAALLFHLSLPTSSSYRSCPIFRSIPWGVGMVGVIGREIHLPFHTFQSFPHLPSTAPQ
jgi:hypothetical protein